MNNLRCSPALRIVPMAFLALILAFVPGLVGCGGGADTTPRVLDDPPPPDPDEMSSDNMPDPSMIQSLHDSNDQ